MGMWPWRRGPASRAQAAAPHAPTPAVDLAELRSTLTTTGAQSARLLADERLKQHPHDAGLRLFSSRIHRKLGQPDQALLDCEEALLHAEDPAQVHLEFAQCHIAASDLTSALESLDVAVTLDPALGEAWLVLGELLAKLDRKAEGIAALEQALTHCAPEHMPRAHHAIGRLQSALGKTADALSSYEACLALEPDHVNALIGLGDAMLMSDEEPQALVLFERALKQLDNPPSGLLMNIAVAQQQLGRRAEARKTFEAVLSQEPGNFSARWYLCQLDLLECQWEAAWRNYGARLCVSPVHFRPLPYKRWAGEPARGDTVLVLAGEGLGDEIMYGSCLPDAIAQTGHCIVDCDPRLQALYKRSFPQATVVSSDRSNDGRWLNGLPTPQWQIPASELPPLFRRRGEDFPAHQGYLMADPQRVAAWTERLQEDLGPGFKIGLSWRGGTPRTRAKTRSIETAQWQPILSVPGVHFVNLQYGDYQAELDALNQTHDVAIADYPEALASYDETAALVSALDLVITVCTAIVHLSGALGRPLWILTPHSPSWRYTAEAASLPWYPSSRVFRQPHPGDWETPCQEVSSQLIRLTKNVAHPLDRMPRMSRKTRESPL